MEVGDEEWLARNKAGRDRYWAELTPEKRAERLAKGAETRRRNKELAAERRAKQQRYEARLERGRLRKLERKDEAALEVLGPAPLPVFTYVPTEKDRPWPDEWATISPAYVLRRSQRFWAYVDRSGGPDACWPWHGPESQTYGSYGITWWRGHSNGAHRVAWQLHYRLEIPWGWVGDHMCGCKWCCSWDHIEPVPHGENVRRNHIRPATATRVRTSWVKPERWYPFGRQTVEADESWDESDNETAWF